MRLLRECKDKNMDTQEINNNEKSLSAEEITILLSKTMKDVIDRKITIRQGLAVSRIASALVKATELTDLSNRIDFLEQVLKKKKEKIK